jgi:thioesterase domain-containing protein
MAAQYVREVRELQPEGPYRLVGYCFGGTVAFEMARQLQAGGHAVALLALLDAAAPGRLATFFGRVRRLRQRIALYVGRLADRPSDVLRATVRERTYRIVTRMAARTARALGREAPVDRAIRQAEEAHLRALRAYVPQPYAGPVTLFLSPRLPTSYGNPALDWRPLAAGGLSICEIGGAQGDIVNEPRVRALAAELVRRLGTED